MKNIKYTYLAILTLLFSACSSEDPFEGISTDGEGRLLSSSIELEVKSEDYTTRAVATPDPKDFSVEFYNYPKSDNASPILSYKYENLPEVITLPVGEYIATAWYGGDYGEGKTAGFDVPYYLGESEVFSIIENKIMDSLQPIICSPANVKVAVFFDSELVKVMSPDSRVSVRVGQSGVLDFTPETDADGYFAYDEGSNTLAATFSGRVNGVSTIETKTYDNVKAGLFYRVTFRLHTIDPNDPSYPGGEDPNQPDEPKDPNGPGTDPENPGGDDPQPPVSGDITTSGGSGTTFKVDASVTFRDISGEQGTSVNPEGDIYLVDDMRPGYVPGENPGTENPGNTPDDDPGETPGKDPNEPGIDDPQPPVHEKPSVKGILGTTDSNTNPSSFNVMVESESEAGITGFIVDIISDSLTPTALKEVGMTDHIDLINPGEFKDKISSLGFPVEKEVKGQQKVTLTIDPEFIGLLSALGESTTEFKFTVTDEYGTTVKSIFIIIK